MEERVNRYFMAQSLSYARAAGLDRVAAGKKMRAGAICCWCDTPLSQPHNPGLKQCPDCSGKHRVYMSIHLCSGWHCRFTAEGRRPLPKRVIFSNTDPIIETAKRARGLISDWAREDLELAIDLGRGGIWLMLTDEQFQALGGVL